MSGEAKLRLQTENAAAGVAGAKDAIERVQRSFPAVSCPWRAELDDAVATLARVSDEMRAVAESDADRGQS